VPKTNRLFHTVAGPATGTRISLISPKVRALMIRAEAHRVTVAAAAWKVLREAPPDRALVGRGHRVLRLLAD
jgi:hypothetical protein